MKCKQIFHTSKVISNRHIILMKILASFFSSAGKNENVPEFEFDTF